MALQEEPHNTVPFYCPSCDQRLEATCEMEGDNISCPSCGNNVCIPEKPKTKKMPRAASSPLPESAPCNQDITQQESERTRAQTGVCPHCGRASGVASVGQGRRWYHSLPLLSKLRLSRKLALIAFSVALCSIVLLLYLWCNREIDRRTFSAASFSLALPSTDWGWADTKDFCQITNSNGSGLAVKYKRSKRWGFDKYWYQTSLSPEELWETELEAMGKRLTKEQYSLTARKITLIDVNPEGVSRGEIELEESHGGIESVRFVKRAEGDFKEEYTLWSNPSPDWDKARRDAKRVFRTFRLVEHQPGTFLTGD